MSPLPNSEGLPVHDIALDLYLEALDARWSDDEDVNGDPVIDGITLDQVLDFYSGYDPADSFKLPNGHTVHPKTTFSKADLIRTLIEEIKRLRNE